MPAQVCSRCDRAWPHIGAHSYKRCPVCDHDTRYEYARSPLLPAEIAEVLGALAEPEREFAHAEREAARRGHDWTAADLLVEMAERAGHAPAGSQEG